MPPVQPTQPSREGVQDASLPGIVRALEPGTPKPPAKHGDLNLAEVRQADLADPTVHQHLAQGTTPESTPTTQLVASTSAPLHGQPHIANEGTAQGPTPRTQHRIAPTSKAALAVDDTKPAADGMGSAVHSTVTDATATDVATENKWHNEESVDRILEQVRTERPPLG